MKCVHYGNPSSPAILLLHGGGLSWWNYREVALLLQEDYHVVLPILDGHAGSNAPFGSIEENAERIIRYIEKHMGGQIQVLGGVSLGAQIAAEMLAQRPNICGCALLESALVRPGKLTHALIPFVFGMSYGLIRQRWFSRLQAAYLGIPKSMFEDYYRDTGAITKADMIAFLQSNSTYHLNDALRHTAAQVRIVAGSREPAAMLASAEMLHAAIPGSSMEILPGFAHGEFSLRHPQLYAQSLREWMEICREDGN